MVAVMARARASTRFGVAGHDRGGRVAHRMALDHPGRGRAGGGARHRPDPHAVRRDRPGVRHRLLPLVLPHPARRPAGAADRRATRSGSCARPCGAGRGRARAGGGGGDRRVRALLRRPRRDPRLVRGLPGGRRRSTSSTTAADAGARMACPLLVLWGAHGAMERLYDVLGTWRDTAADVRGRSLPCGHFLPEEAPEETAAELAAFFGRHARLGRGRGRAAGRRRLRSPARCRRAASRAWRAAPWWCGPGRGGGPAAPRARGGLVLVRARPR